MSITVKGIRSAIDCFMERVHDQKFCKTYNIKEMSECEILPFMRFYLLGVYKDKLIPEFKSKSPRRNSGRGSIDFKIGDIAVEVAVRAKKSKDNTLTRAKCEHEVEKLSKYNGFSLLVLLDFNAKPMTDTKLNEYYNRPTMGSGHTVKPFNVYYVCRKRGGELVSRYMQVKAK